MSMRSLAEVLGENYPALLKGMTEARRGESRSAGTGPGQWFQAVRPGLRGARMGVDVHTSKKPGRCPGSVLVSGW